MHDSQAGIAFSMLVIFASAKLLSEICERLRLPGVVGEILAGIAIGPYVLGWIMPNPVLTVLSELGVMFLLFRIGLEVKPSELLALGGRASVIAISGVVVPFAAGWGIATAWKLPSVEAIFIGAALVATSVGITAQVLSAGGWLDARASQIILAAAVIDDVLGLLVLAAVSGLANGRVNYLDLSLTAGLAVAFVVLVATLGSRAMRGLVPRVKSRMKLAESEFALALILLFALSLLAARAGVAAIVGAFLAGMALSETVEHRVHILTEGVTGFLTPFFLVGIGLQFDPTPFRAPATLVLAGVLCLAAILSKFVGCGIAALNLGRKDAMRIGVGMIPRGEVGVVVAQVGLSRGILSAGIYGMIVFISLVTTIVAPPLLKLVFRDASSTWDPLESTCRHASLSIL